MQIRIAQVGVTTFIVSVVIFVLGTVAWALWPIICSIVAELRRVFPN